MSASVALNLRLALARLNRKPALRTLLTMRGIIIVYGRGSHHGWSGGGARAAVQPT